MWNFFDHRLRNDTETTFQLRVRADGEQLRGELRSDAPPGRDIAERG